MVSSSDHVSNSSPRNFEMCPCCTNLNKIRSLERLDCMPRWQPLTLVQVSLNKFKF